MPILRIEIKMEVPFLYMKFGLANMRLKLVQNVCTKMDHFKEKLKEFCSKVLPVAGRQ